MFKVTILYSFPKKETYKPGSVYKLVSKCGPYNRLKNLSAAVNAIRSATRVLLRERGLEPKVNVFCTKIVYFRSRAEQTVTTQACHSGGKAPSYWVIFAIYSENSDINAI